MKKKKSEPAPSSPRALNVLSSAARSAVYAACQFSSKQEQLVEHLFDEGGSREVGRGALNNVISLFHSRKNGATRQTESHTCEQLFAYELELDPEVVGYQTQIPCAGVTRLLPSGKKHVSAPTVDFLVLRHNKVELVECKTEDWLEGVAATKPEWFRDPQGVWHNTPREEWATERGLNFRVWASPRITGIYLRNLELIYAAGGAEPESDEQSLQKRAGKLLAQCPHTLADLEESIPGFHSGVAAKMIAAQKAYGLLRSRSLSNPDLFYLFDDASHAHDADGAALLRLTSDLADVPIYDPICVASTTDMQAARERLARVNAIKEGNEKSTRRMVTLARKVAEAVAQGRPPIEACLTRYSRCGNRTPRLDSIQLEAIDEVIRVHWQRGKARTKGKLHNRLQEMCTQKGVATPSLSVLGRKVRAQDPAHRALCTAGMRGYQAIRSVSDPRFRSMQALAYGHTIHIDSTDTDLLVAADAELGAGPERPRFYVAVDEASGSYMAHALYFGSPNSDAFAMVLRDYVYRNKRLPCLIFVDRGPDQDTNWLKEFCFLHGITLRFSPTAAGRFNSAAETAVKKVNVAIAHQLDGNTLLDVKGRAADAKFKSRRNARTRFEILHEGFVHYLYTHAPQEPGGDGLTPIERRADALERFGHVGRPQVLDEGFRIQTSIPMKFPHRGSERHGIRTSFGTYTSEALSLALRTNQPEEVRRDCVDPTLVYVRVDEQWYRASHSKVLSAAQLSHAGKIWLSAEWDCRRHTATSRRKELSLEGDRFIDSLRGKVANDHLRAPTTNADGKAVTEAEPPEGIGEAPDGTTCEPFPEE